jgi:hypothetical protein
MSAGGSAASLHLVLDGTVAVRRRGHTVRLGSNELVGEIEVLAPGGGRPADVVAQGRCAASR